MKRNRRKAAIDEENRTLRMMERLNIISLYSKIGTHGKSRVSGIELNSIDYNRLRNGQ